MYQVSRSVPAAFWFPLVLTNPTPLKVTEVTSWAALWTETCTSNIVFDPATVWAKVVVFTFPGLMLVTESKVMGQGIAVPVAVGVNVQVFPGNPQGVGVGAQENPAPAPVTATEPFTTATPALPLTDP